jgi:two-component sensor histidine kinase
MLNLSRWTAYAFAIATVAVAALAQSVLDSTGQGLGFVVFLPAVTIIAFVAGVRPAVVVAVAGTVCALHEPWLAAGPVRADDIVRAALFALAAGVEILVIQNLNATVVEARAANAVLTETLAGQKNLFQELQHRVANNIQFVASVLTLHRNRVSQQASTAIDALDAARDRLTNVARVHRRLSDPAGFSTSPRLYLEELCGDLVNGFPINVVCKVDPGLPTLSPTRLVTLSLIVTEGVTNALKHAFPDTMVGTIAIELTRIGSGAAALAIRDNGRGLPPDFATRQGNSLGFRILEGLAHQLDGVLRFESGDGTTLRVDFKP